MSAGPAAETGKCGHCHMHWKVENGALRRHMVPASQHSRVFIQCPGSDAKPVWIGDTPFLDK